MHTYMQREGHTEDTASFEKKIRPCLFHTRKGDGCRLGVAPRTTATSVPGSGDLGFRGFSALSALGFRVERSWVSGLGMMVDSLQRLPRASLEGTSAHGEVLTVAPGKALERHCRPLVGSAFRLVSLAFIGRYICLPGLAIWAGSTQHQNHIV